MWDEMIAEAYYEAWCSRTGEHIDEFGNWVDDTEKEEAQ